MMVAERLSPVSHDEFAAIVVGRKEAERKYLYERKKSRSFWRNLGSSIKAGFGKNSPDKKLESLRGEYLKARDMQIVTGALMHLDRQADSGLIDIGEAPTFRDKLAESLVGMAESLDQKFSDAELNHNQQNGLEKAAAWIYKRPLLRGLTGWGLNIGIGVSIATGALPVAAGLGIARAGLAVIGTEGFVHKIQDMYSQKKGAKMILTQEDLEGLPTEKLLDRQAAFYEDRVKKGVKEVDPTEALISKEIYNRAYQEIRPRITDLSPDDLIRMPLAERLKVGLLAKDQSLVWNRRATVGRWLGSALVVGLGSYLSFDLIRIGDAWRFNLEDKITLPLEANDPAPVDSGVDAKSEPTAPEPVKPAPVPVSPDPAVKMSPEWSLDKPFISPNLPSDPAFEGKGYKFFNDDPLYSNLWQRGHLDTYDVSSLTGFAEGMLGWHYLGLSFNPYDAEYRRMFDLMWNADPQRYAFERDQLIKYVRLANSFGIYHHRHLDLIHHHNNLGVLNEVNIPSSTARFLSYVRVNPLVSPVAAT